MRTLSLSDWNADAKELRGADEVVLIEANGLRYGDGATGFFRRLDTLTVPTVTVVSGQCDASALALLASVSLGFAADDLRVEVAADTVLALGLTSLLSAPPLRSLLFTQPDAAALRRCGLAQEGAPEEAAVRLADPSAALLVRSLRVAARSTPAQAREYDAELRRLA
ncbi:enoyl-CoA hydratase/carnithine racemase [Amycolatopsis bartoniae]|uniref:Uncharacterized protein n=1 Tax=Amycolatopsis bartoniae TaxID=941986 RepID=A0A8H9MB21_9PSEU|nr:hypothetical protein [Amycolatopsis bartoniae]MBB2937879.1 enoyl-CoA hydratase/carnithine racemase [Amycolatopsis bartoniae]TVT01312.1 hypothetical protein FNH07_29570 [Amycolatopsis bartoniae]GHF41407.1 hypothetical protein GCM10017566_13560 [Amycolatopsis bartoniae]